MKRNRKRSIALTVAALLALWGVAVQSDDVDAESTSRDCIVRSEHAGRDGWYRGPVEIDCAGLLLAEGAEVLEYSMGFGDWQKSAGSSVRLQEEGVYWVQVRGVDESGNSSIPETLLIPIDRTAPQLQMQEPAKTMTHNDELTLIADATDELSGVSLLIGEIDFEHEITPDVPVDLWRLPLGPHTLTLYAQDRAGNTVRSAEPFLIELTVDIPALQGLVRRFAASGKLDSITDVQDRLLGHLNEAETALRSDETAAARTHLMRFVEDVRQGMAEGRIFTEEGNLLDRDATWLLAQMSGNDSSPPPDWG